ncbi:hypothetical protein CTI12_AA078410 [Artemisia annua]|uniref:RRM domain-containing protein n=1 Tax=Artemisia annua TaxID=35608 RepID=A0A2U1Q3J3_ARTAN|nr:hypothetical protein CTI12_AA078410 [Artemisia annua]
MGKFSSKEDDVDRISTSVYVTNIPESVTAKDLFQACKQYGHAVDSYIPNKKSKTGKRFGFVKFINVFSEERLVNNLCTVWMGRLKLHANIARFQRSSSSKEGVGIKKAAEVPRYPEQTNKMGKQGNVNSYKEVLNGDKNKEGHGPLSSSPALVLDDSCVVDRDLSCHVMGRVKDICSIPNLLILLAKEGFEHVKLSFLGGLWVMIELDNVSAKQKLLEHVGVNSWFQTLHNATNDFVSSERVVWVDIEGIPLNVWSRETFSRIGKKWGEALDIEDNSGSSFARKRFRHHHLHHHRPPLRTPPPPTVTPHRHHQSLHRDLLCLFNHHTRPRNHHHHHKHHVRPDLVKIRPDPWLVVVAALVYLTDGGFKIRRWFNDFGDDGGPAAKELAPKVDV